MSDIGDVLSQKPLIREADTRSIFDSAKENGITFQEQFDRSVKNIKYYSIPEEMKLRNILQRKLRIGLHKFLRIFRNK